MATKKTEQEIDVLQAENDEGEVIPDADVLARGRAPMLVKFRAAGQTHKAELVMAQITYEQRQAVGDMARSVVRDVGFVGGEELTEPETRARIIDAQHQLVNSPEWQKLRAELAVSAIARDGQGRCRISIPQFRDGLTVQALLDDAIFGRAVIDAVNAEVDGFFGS